MKIRLALAALVAAIGTTLVLLPGVAAAQPPAAQAVTLPTTTCTLSAVLGGGTCTVQLTGFQVIGGQPNAVLNLLNSAGQVVATVTVPLQGIFQVTGTCEILDLTIGPIHLDLLGLVIDTNAIHLRITAESGPGNLLGNLLCAIAHLLDNPSGQVTGLVNLLNNLLRQGGTIIVIPPV
jgi:hypothetical protein